MLAEFVDCINDIYRVNTSCYDKTDRAGVYNYWRNHWLPIRGALYVNGYILNYLERGIADFLVKEIFSDETYYTPLSHEPFIIDVGSNIGVSIHYFKHKYPNANIFGFEPSKQVFDVLDKNVKLNNLSKVSLINAAVSDMTGQVDFYYTPKYNGSSSIYEPGGESIKETVDCVRLSDYIKGHVDLIKMDCEGAENKIIKELEVANKLQLIDNMVIEYHYNILGDKPLVEIMNILIDNGFQIRQNTIGINPHRNWFDTTILYAKKTKLVKEAVDEKIDRE
jgi:FkbM family methyltransferase